MLFVQSSVPSAQVFAVMSSDPVQITDCIAHVEMFRARSSGGPVSKCITQAIGALRQFVLRTIASMEAFEDHPGSMLSRAVRAARASSISH